MLLLSHAEGRHVITMGSELHRLEMTMVIPAYVVCYCCIVMYTMSFHLSGTASPTSSPRRPTSLIRYGHNCCSVPLADNRRLLRHQRRGGWTVSMARLVLFTTGLATAASALGHHVSDVGGLIPYAVGTAGYGRPPLIRASQLSTTRNGHPYEIVG